MPPGWGRPTAITRLVPLAPLLAQRAWCTPHELVERFVTYGAARGAWDDADGYTEGSLARIVEAADASARLPSVRTTPGFLCGLEFDDIHDEVAFFVDHGLALADVQVDIRLAPGDVLVFDNLAVAHGRRGARHPAELRQWIFGHRRVDLAAQAQVRDRFLARFGPGPRVDVSGRQP